MAKLIYSTISSFDGYVQDETDNLGWAAPDDEVHAFVNDLERPIGTYLYGRKMYEVMVFWASHPTVADDPGRPDPTVDFARIWQGAQKVVYSTTLEGVSTPATRLERNFDPEAVRALKAAGSRDLSIGGPHLAAQAIKAGLVDEFHFFLHPIVVGGGNPSLPDHVRLDLQLVDERRFGSGLVHLHYRAGS